MKITIIRQIMKRQMVKTLANRQNVMQQWCFCVKGFLGNAVFILIKKNKAGVRWKVNVLNNPFSFITLF